MKQTPFACLANLAVVFATVTALAGEQPAGVPADLAEVLRSYDSAQVNNDIVTLAFLVADDFLLVNSDASTENKQQYLADFRLPGFKIEPYQVQQPVAKIWQNAAVTGGVIHLRWTQDGKQQTR